MQPIQNNPTAHPTSFRRQFKTEINNPNSYLGLLVKDIPNHIISLMLNSSIDEAVALHKDRIALYVQDNIKSVMQSEYEDFIPLITERMRSILGEWHAKVLTESAKNVYHFNILNVQIEPKFANLAKIIFETAFDVRTLVEGGSEHLPPPALRLFPKFQSCDLSFFWSPKNNSLYKFLEPEKI